MNKEAIPEPDFNKRNKELLDFLKKKNVFIKWFKTKDLKGGACSRVNGRYAEIVFRDKEPITQYKISHELLHICLFVKGYSRIICREKYTEYDDAIVTLGDIFEHIIMTPFLKTLKKEECLAVERGIDSLRNSTEEERCKQHRKMFLNLSYVRAKTMDVDHDKLQQLEYYLKINNLYDDKMIKSIIDNLPKPNSGIKDYKHRLKKCRGILELNYIADIDNFGDKK